MNVTLRQLQAFRAIADLGSFTRAAQRLQIAQPALSLSIRELESELGARLFDRTTRRVELTAVGREFLQSVDKLISDLDNAVRNARDLTERKRGRLVIAAPPLLAALVVPGAIAEYRKKFPGIEVRLIDTQTNIIVEKVHSGEADCGIGTFADAEEGIRRDVLFHDTFMLWCSSHSPPTRASTMVWKDLKELPLITLTRDSNVRALSDKALEASGILTRPAYEVAHMTTAVMLVEAGLGVAVLPAYLWNFARAFKVIPKRLLEPQVRREVAFIHASNRSLSAAAEGFLRFARNRTRDVLPQVLRDSRLQAG
jgi:DNA-binding transcriptional LysR family regulator